MLIQIKFLLKLIYAKYQLWAAHRLVCECSAIIELCEKEKTMASRALIYAVQNMSKKKKEYKLIVDLMKD